MVIQEQALSKLANAMRIYGEAHMNFNRLKLVDAEEAIDNLDRAMEAGRTHECLVFERYG